MEAFDIFSVKCKSLITVRFFIIFSSRLSLSSYILGLDSDSGKNKKEVEDMFSPVFSALLDAFLLRAQVFLFYTLV